MYRSACIETHLHTFVENEMKARESALRITRRSEFYLQAKRYHLTPAGQIIVFFLMIHMDVLIANNLMLATCCFDAIVYYKRFQSHISRNWLVFCCCFTFFSICFSLEVSSTLSEWFFFVFLIAARVSFRCKNYQPHSQWDSPVFLHKV